MILAAALLIVPNIAAGTLSGTVRNGTTGAAAAGQEVILIQLTGGMETVATARTDAQGRFTVEHSAIGQGPVLVRVTYRGVNFHQNVPPGRAVADVDVFEPTTDLAAFAITSRAIIFQPNGPALLVGEEFSILNNTSPPRAYFKADGTFEFEVPAGAQLGQVAAWGSSGMPVGQGTIDKAKNRYAIAFPFRPGESGIRLAYQLPYAANSAALRAVSPYAARRVSLIAPPSMQVQAAGFTLSGTEQGWNVYVRENVPAAMAFAISVSGTAPPPAEAQAGADAAGGAGAPAVSQLPGRLDNLRWILIGGFSVLFALGVAFLWRRQAPAVAGGPAPARAAGGNSSKVSAALAEMDGQVGQSLEQIKELLFRLELRRQAGTISEDEYARERSRAEKVLRDFLKG